jgi:hypothetical protein
MTTISISITWVDPPPLPTFKPGLHHIAEIMPHVLASHGLAMPDAANVKPPVVASEVVIAVMLDALEAALAS